MKHTVFLLITCLTAVSLTATNVLKVSEQKGAFALVKEGRAASVYVGPDEPFAVQKVAGLFADDVEQVTGVRPAFIANPSAAAVIVATLGHDTYVDQLVARHQLDVSPIQGDWERYLIKVVGSQLLIVGSDRRGAAYGVLSLSEEMGVSPWYWWADVPVIRHQNLFVDADYVSQPPTVKYRGIFINDED